MTCAASRPTACIWSIHQAGRQTNAVAKASANTSPEPTTASLVSPYELIMDILKYGPDVEVLKL